MMRQAWRLFPRGKASGARRAEQPDGRPSPAEGSPGPGAWTPGGGPIVDVEATSRFKPTDRGLAVRSLAFERVHRRSVRT